MALIITLQLWAKKINRVILSMMSPDRFVKTTINSPLIALCPKWKVAILWLSMMPARTALPWVSIITASCDQLNCSLGKMAKFCKSAARKQLTIIWPLWILKVYQLLLFNQYRIDNAKDRTKAGNGRDCFLLLDIIPLPF